MDRLRATNNKPRSNAPEAILPRSTQPSPRQAKPVQAPIQASYERDNQIDDDSPSTDRTPIVLGIIAFAVAACLHWLPADSLPHHDIDKSVKDQQSVVLELRT